MEKDIIDKKRRIKECLKRIKGDFFSEEQFLISGGFIDSFEVLKLVHEIEEEFSIKIMISQISPDSFDSISSIKEVIECGISQREDKNGKSSNRLSGSGSQRCSR